MKRLALAGLVFVCSCTHQPQYHVAPVTPVTPVTPVITLACDSMDVSYNKVIHPIFRNNCYECHSATVTNGGGLNLEDTASLKSYLNKGFRGDGVYGSMLYHCLLHSQNAQRMPPSYILDSCSLHKIHHWLTLGAPIQ